MKFILTGLLIFLSLLLHAQRFKVSAYISGDSLISAKQIDAKKITHLHYTFASIQNGQVASGTNDSINFIALRQLKLVNPKLKLLISIGGRHASNDFAQAVNSDSSREAFASSAMQYLKKYQFDGIEIHWVQKSRGMFGNSFNRKDQQNLVLLLQTLREKVDMKSKMEGKKKKQRYLLCMAGSSKRQYLFYSQLNTAHQYLDYINLQTFDYKVEILNSGGVSSTLVSSHHSNLYPSRNDSWMRLCVDKTVKEYVNHAIPARKLVMGIPFYGQGWGNTYGDFNGLYQWAEYKLTDDLSDKNISAHYLHQSDYTYYWDKQAKVPYLYNKKNGHFIAYDNKKSIRKKTRYIHRHKMGGAICNDYRQDDGSLLKPMRRGLRRITFPFLIF